MSTPDNLGAQVTQLVKSVQLLTGQVAEQTRVRRRSTKTLSVVLVLLSLALGWLTFRQQQTAAATACRAVNTTNAVLLRLIDRASAASPATPPAGATAEQLRAFQQQQTAAVVFYAQTRRDLAPREC